MRVTHPAPAPLFETPILSAPIVDLGTIPTRGAFITAGNYIVSFGSTPYIERLVRFEASLSLVHTPPNLIVPGSGVIVTQAGDTCLAVSDASGNYTVRAYQRSNGKPIVNP